MRKFWSIAITTTLLMACASLPRYSAPFADVDLNQDGVIEWREFKAHFPDSDAKDFLEADGNKNGEISPDEWRTFLEKQ